MTKNIIIAVSGTGGHVYPGMALAGELKQLDFNPVFIVNNNRNGVSLKIVKESGFDYKILDFKAPPRKISLSMIFFPFKFITAYFKAKKIIKNLHPEAVIGMGAYLSFPVLIAAKSKKIPTMIHEQNSIPGLANKILSKFVNKTAVSFKESQKYFESKNIIYTSNPVRKDIFGISRKDAAQALKLKENVFTVFVFGGSLGSEKLNKLMCKAAKKLYSGYGNKIQFIHIFGNRDFEKLEGEYDSIKCGKYITEYMNDIGKAYACADVIICRAGAGTVKETELYNIPALFVPFPHATANHQFFNAKSVKKANLRAVIKEEDLTADCIVDFVKNFFTEETDASRIVSPQEYPQSRLAREVVNLIHEAI